MAETILFQEVRILHAKSWNYAMVEFGFNADVMPGYHTLVNEKKNEKECHISG